MPDLISLSIYLPALILTLIARRAGRRYFDAYRHRYGPEALARFFPRTTEEWMARYGHRPYASLRDAPAQVLAMFAFARQREPDPEIAHLRSHARLFGSAAVALLVAAMLVNIILVAR